MKCFYHGDADGLCAGFWVKSSATKLDCYPEEYIEINYGTPFPFDTILPDEQIYIVDYSIEPGEMMKLLKITPDVTWIDHHKTAIEKYIDFPIPIRGVRYDGVSGCMLTYCYLNHMTRKGVSEIKDFERDMMIFAPAFTTLIDDWDVWKHDYPQTKEFILAFNSNYTDLSDSALWFLLLDGFHVNRLIEEGRIIKQYNYGIAKELCEKKGFETIIKGHRAFALNQALCNSEYFTSIDETKYDLFIAFSFDGELWSVSLYSTSVDVSQIAKCYGGGGHKGAAGFVCMTLPFMSIY